MQLNFFFQKLKKKYLHTIKKNISFAKKNKRSLIMQILKKDIRKNIVNTAIKLFYKHGFEKTLTRQIAGELNMSVSNLYKYFKNKEAIFEEIVNSYYEEYLIGFTKFIAHENQDSFDDESNLYMAKAISESIKNKQIEFVLLMDKSKGTKYSSFKDEIMTKLEKHIREGIHESYKDEYMIKIFVRNFFYGIVEIAKQNKNDDWVFKNINLLVQYHMNGISVLYP
jgi:AcrR family transcriptional regulator